MKLPTSPPYPVSLFYSTRRSGDRPRKHRDRRVWPNGHPQGSGIPGIAQSSLPLRINLPLQRFQNMSMASHTAEPYHPSAYKNNCITSQTCSRLNVDPNRPYISPQHAKTSWMVPNVSPLIGSSSNPHPAKLLPAQRLRAERGQITMGRPGFWFGPPSCCCSKFLNQL